MLHPGALHFRSSGELVRPHGLQGHAVLAEVVEESKELSELDSLRLFDIAVLAACVNGKLS